MSPLRTHSLKGASDFVQMWDELQRLREELDVEDDVLLNPLHFLSATDDTRRSCSVACTQGDKLVAVVFATEHYVRGVPSGYAVGGDYSGRGLLLCHAEHESAVLRASIEHMFAAGVHSLHVRLLPKTHTKISVPGVVMKYLDSVVPGDRLMLDSDYDKFLGTLGKHTRRNIRNFARKAAQAGIEFVPSLTKEEYEAGVARLNAETAFQAEPLRLARDERLLALYDGGLRMGLRNQEGKLVAILCGFMRGGRFHLLTQLNDMALERLSLSMVLRGHAINHLISEGCGELQFMGGSSLIFGRFCSPLIYRSIFIDKKKGVAAVAKQVCGGAVRLMAQFGKPAPDVLTAMSSGYLDDLRLSKRTALAAASIVFPRGQTS